MHSSYSNHYSINTFFYFSSLILGISSMYWSTVEKSFRSNCVKLSLCLKEAVLCKLWHYAKPGNTCFFETVVAWDFLLLLCSLLLWFWVWFFCCCLGGCVLLVGCFLALFGFILNHTHTPKKPKQTNNNKKPKPQKAFEM